MEIFIGICTIIGIFVIISIALEIGENDLFKYANNELPPIIKKNAEWLNENGFRGAKMLTRAMVIRKSNYIPYPIYDAVAVDGQRKRIAIANRVFRFEDIIGSKLIASKTSEKIKNESFPQAIDCGVVTDGISDTIFASGVDIATTLTSDIEGIEIYTTLLNEPIISNPFGIIPEMPEPIKNVLELKQKQLVINREFYNNLFDIIQTIVILNGRNTE